MVSAGSSSALIMMTLPLVPCDPSGITPSLLTRAARSKSRVDLPNPGSPSRMASLPSGSQLGHSHAAGLGCTSLNLESGLAAGFSVGAWDDVVDMGDSPGPRFIISIQKNMYNAREEMPV